jgi:hypothetical protein
MGPSVCPFTEIQNGYCCRFGMRNDKSCNVINFLYVPASEPSRLLIYSIDEMNDLRFFSQADTHHISLG